MKLTGKCAKDFAEWYLKTQHEESIHRLLPYDLKDYPENMQFGVYQDFFDSVGLSVEIVYFTGNTLGYIINHNNEDNPNPLSKMVGDRYEARKSAIERANELYNVRHGSK